MPFDKLPWVLHTNVYEVNVRQYTPEGSFRAFMKHMPRLCDMGVETLWFMPVTPISVLKRKGTMGSYYACSSYTSVNPEFGTLEDFRELVSYAHVLGMKVIIDWVANHTGADHEWTMSNPDFFIRNEQGQFYDKHGWDDVIDLDYGNRRMREEMKNCMEFWVRECDIDGFRCDMAMLVPVDFWLEARQQLDGVKKLFWLAECDQWNDPVYLEAFDAAYTWKWMHASRDHHQWGFAMEELKKILVQYDALQPAGAIRAWFTSNHDENSWNGTEYERYGNMAIPLAVFSATWNGVPLIYSGQELPVHKRIAFFDKDAIDWSGEVQLHSFYRALLGLRRTHPCLNASLPINTSFIHTDHQDKVLCYARRDAGSEVLVFLNFSQWPLDVQVYDAADLTSYRSLFPCECEQRMVRLPAFGHAVLFT